MICMHECDPYPTEPIVVSDEEFYASPLGNFTPPRIVPCKHCGAPLDRGRYTGVIAIPALRRGPEWPPWLNDNA
jgi:hypothetical protein